MGVIDTAISWAVSIANNDNYKYVWGGWGASDGGYDCGHFVITAYRQAGIDTGATYTGDMYNCFTAKGFQDVTSSCNLSTGAGMKKGDVLLNTEKHAAMVQIDGGTTVEARGRDYGIVANVPYRNYPWDYVLRYPDSSSSGKVIRVYTTFPKYNLSESAIKDIATMITGEQGGDDVLACRQEASQLANLNEVTYGRSNTESAILKSLHGGWYNSSSWDNGCTQKAIEAVRFVLVEGKRVLPRYVTEHDMFPLDAAISGHWYNGSSEDRSQYKQHSTVIRQNPNRFRGGGSSYTFYCFFGSNGDKDVAGYYSKDYEKYKNDIPWTEGADNETYMYSENAYEDTEPTVVWNNRVQENIHPKLQGLSPIASTGELTLYADGADITKYAGNLSWSNSIYELSTTMSFDIAKTDAAYLKDLITAPIVGAAIQLVTNTEVFRGIVTKIDDGDKNSNKYTAVDLGWYLNKTSQTYQFTNITASDAIKEICSDLCITIDTIPELTTIIKKIYFSETISNILTDILDQCDGDYNFDFTPNGLRIYKIGTLEAYPEFRIADNIPQQYAPDYRGNVSHSTSIEDM